MREKRLDSTNQVFALTALGGDPSLFSDVVIEL